MKAILTAEEAAAHHAALEAAATRLAVEGNTPEAVEAWTRAEAAFQAAQLAVVATWPFAYVGGEAPQVGDVIAPAEAFEPRMTVIALAPPELRVGGHLGDLAERAYAMGATLHPSLTCAIPQLCRLVRRAHPLPDA